MFLYIHTNIVTKKWGEKTSETIFQKHTNSASKKCWKKNRRKKVRKTFFYIHTNIVTKYGGEKTRETIFQKHNNSANKKCWEKNLRREERKDVVYIQTNIVTKKWGEKYALNNVSRNMRIVRAKNV